MSRRKQARPRLVKREEDDDDDDDLVDPLESEEPPEKKLCRIENQQVSNRTNDVTSDNGAESERFRCESCSVSFENLVRFMDHKNTQCKSGERSRSATPSSLWSVGSNLGAAESPVVSLKPEDLPYHIGVDDTHSIACQLCDKAFTKVSYLRVHERVHSDALPFSCPICARVFKNKRGRDRHVTTHNAEKEFQCTKCEFYTASAATLHDHVMTHDVELYSCQTCSLNFPTMAALMSHQYAHRQKASNKLDNKCVGCGETFYLESDLQNHKCNGICNSSTFQCPHCTALCVGPAALALHTEHAHPRIGTEQHKCPLCFKCFLMLDELVAHLKVHEIPVQLSSRESALSSSCITSVDYGISMVHGSTGLCPKDVLVCPYCLRDDFETLEGLELHMQSVHSVKPTEVYTCNYCNAPYKNLYSLHEHMRAIHQNQPSMGIKYPCSRCGKEYPSIEALQDHKKRMHYKHKQDHALTCSLCSLSFINSASLSDHVRLAHGETNRGIEESNLLKSLTSTSSPKSQKLTLLKPRDNLNDSEGHTMINVAEPSQLLRHLRSPAKNSTSPTGTVHHMATYASGFLRSSPPSTSPKVKSEQNMTCDQCNAKFSDLITYQTHMKLHLDPVITQYSCRQCNKLFLSEEQMEVHMAGHYLSMSAEYGCVTCIKTFNKPDELQKHLMDIHAHHLYKCSLCKELFDSKVNIQVHFAIKHSNETKIFRCVACDSVYRSETEWQLHLRVAHLHLAKPYRCLFCKESFPTEMDLQCHLASHNKPFKCSMCDESFLVEFLLDKHIQNIHSSETVRSGEGSAKRIENINIKIENDSEKRCSNQESCTASIFFNTSMSSTGSQQSSQASVANTLLSNSSTLLHIISSVSSGTLPTEPTEALFHGLGTGPISGSLVWKSPEDLYRCNICDIKFSQLSGLHNHKLQDHGLKYASGKYSPSLSPKISGSYSEIADHKLCINHFSRQMSESVSKMSPSILQDSLTSSLTIPVGSLSEHLMSNNTFPGKLMSTFGEKMCLSCSFCSQTFKCKADLEKHNKIHLNTGSQKCNICDEVFASNGILAEHKLTHCKIQQGNICVACRISIRSEDQFYLHSQEHGFKGAVMQCIVCRQTLASMLELQMHGRHHFQDKAVLYTCCVCLKSFESSETLISKLNSSGRTYYVCKQCYHGESNNFSCNQCSASFNSASALELHGSTHQKSYQCIKCQESFGSENEIQMHVATHMMKEGNIHECLLCFVVLDSPAKLQCHLIEHTYRNTEYRCSVCCALFESASEIQGHALEHGISARKYACNKCNLTFFFSAELENHKLLHVKSSNKSTGSGLDFSQTLTIPPLNYQSLGDFISNQHMPCSSFNTFQHSNDKISTSEDDIMCSKCGKGFQSVFELTDHFKESHADSEKKRNQCQSCLETFNTAIELQAHFFAKHASLETERPKPKHTCMECGKECSSEHNLLTHMNTHRKGNKVSCQLCHRIFATTSGLTAHVITCRQKQHECPICHKLFAKKSSKMEHMKVHSGDKVYPCSSCCKMFSAKSALDEHILVHKERTAMDFDNNTESRSGTSEETSTSAGHASEDDVIDKELSDEEKDGMKQEVSSTSHLAEDDISDEQK